MCRTAFSIIFLLLGTTVACTRAPPPVAATPQPIEARISQQRRTQDSLDAVRRAIADSVALARQTALALEARADSVEHARVAAADAAAKQNATLRDELAVMVHFDFAKAEILSNSSATLDRKVAILKANPRVRLRITGACDDRGSETYNQALGDRRAAAVQRYLVAQGIDATRLEKVSTGEASPIDAGTGEVAWARNRRAEFTILSGDSPLAIPQSAMAQAKQPPVAAAITQSAMAQEKQPPVGAAIVPSAMAQAQQPPVAAAIAQSAMAQTKPPVMLHDKAGREQCTMCHGGAMEGIKAMPADHTGRGNEVCLLCHAKDSPMQATTAPLMAHAVTGREQCMTCHNGAMESVKAAPANHKGIDARYCTLCHTADKK